MPYSIHTKRPTGWPRGQQLALATLVSGVLLAGCGGSSPGSTASTGDSAAASGPSTTSGSSATTGTHTTSTSSTAPTAGGSGPLAFSKCMRANGLPNFPDPSPGGTFQAGIGVDPSSPAFKAAAAKCQKLLGNGGPPTPGSSTHPSSQTMAKLRTIAVCMRAHGVPQFPDPRTSVPSSPAGIAEISNFDGAILLFPASMNLQAPAYKQALAACGAPPLGLPH